MIRALTAYLAISMLIFPASLQAKGNDFRTKAVADKPAFTVDATKAYILVEADQATPIAFVRIPSPAELELHWKDRVEELAKKHASWERTAGKARRPEEPTDENFAWPEYGQSHMVLMGPQNRFSKKGVSLYLQEVPPGQYAYYGAVGDNGNGAIAGVCACMGTVSFEAEAGKVTTLKFDTPFLRIKMNNPDMPDPEDRVNLPTGLTTMELVPTTDAAKDSRIPGDKIVQPEYRPAGRFTNWLGVEIDRLMPIDGVFRYERDKQIDLTQVVPAVPTTSAEPTASPQTLP